MKAFAVPPVVFASNAALSLVFFSGIAHGFGDATLGHILLLQAIAAVVAISCAPQSWVYILAAKEPSELIACYRRGVTIEVAGLSLGAAIIALALMLPWRVLDPWRDGMLVIYLSLAIQGMGSCMGWFRATESWYRYSLWILGANLIRAPLIWATPLLTAHGLLPDVGGDTAAIIAIYFLLPDLVRLSAIALPLALRHYRWPGLAESVAAARTIMQNWFFDLGSMSTEVVDRIAVGLLLGPQTLVAYFFARKVGVIAGMVTEPFFAEQYRRTVLLRSAQARAAMQRHVYLQGIVISVAIFAAIMAAILLLRLMPSVAVLLPAAVDNLFPMFTGVLLVECLLAANRWSRFVALLNGGGARLLLVRVSLLMLFTVNLWLFGATISGLGLALAFALSWVLEAVYVSDQLRRAERPPAQWHAGASAGRERLAE